MKINKIAFAIIIAIIAFSGIVSAETVTESFNVSKNSITSWTIPQDIHIWNDPSNAILSFKDTGSISGFIDAKAIISLNNGPIVMTNGSHTYNIALAGAGDSYSKTRALGTFTIIPLSNITGYTLGVPQYSSTTAQVSIEIKLNQPLNYVTGDTQFFRIYPVGSNGYLFSQLTPGYPIYGGAYVPPSSFAFLAFTSGGNDATATTPDTTLSNGIYGYNLGMLTTSYSYTFENIFTADNVLKTWSVNKTNALGVSTLSQFNITDGLGFTGVYPLNSISTSNTYGADPLTINLTEPHFNTIFLRTYFAPQYSFSIIPTSTNINTPPTESILVGGATPTNLKFVKISDITPGTQYPIFFNSNRSYEYNILKNSSGYWYAWNFSNSDYTVNLGTTFPNNLPLIFNEGGTRVIQATIIDNNNIQTQLTANVTISGTGTNQILEYPIDYSTGNFVPGTTITITDMQTGIKTNRTVQVPNDCVFYYNTGFIQISVTSPGYQSKPNYVEYIDAPRVDQIIMYPSATSGDIVNSTVLIKVQSEPNFNPISGAQVQISPGGFSGITAPSGVFQANNLTNGTTYSVSVSANGYIPTTQYFTIDSNPFSYNVVLEPGTLTTAPTVVQTTYPGQQPSIYPTINGTITNQTNPFFGNTIDWLTYMGAKPTEISVVLAMAIILVGAALGSAASSVGLGYSYQPSPTGAILGAVLGFFADTAFGFIPAWLVIAFGVIAIFLLARKFYGG